MPTVPAILQIPILISILMISMLVNLGRLMIMNLPGHLARRFHQISTALFDIEMREAGLSLTPVQFAALMALKDNPGIDQATLAALIGYDRTTIGGVVDRIEEKGLASRQDNPADRRSKLLRISDAGLATLDQADPFVQRAQMRLTSGLTSNETEQLLRLLVKAVNSMNDISRTSHP